MSRRPQRPHHVAPDPFAPPGGGSKWQQQATAMRGPQPVAAPWTPPRSSSMRKIALDDGEGESMKELSPGILDLHSFDTELLSGVAVPEPYDSGDLFGYSQGRNLGASEPTFLGALPESNLMKSFPSDRDKSGSAAKIKVVVRKRPLNKKEISRREEDIVTILPRANSLVVHETKLKVDLTEYVEKHSFVFDAVLGEDVSNAEVYRETVEAIVPAIFQCTKATCFAYGQTGSGKTYTMQPLPLKASQDILRLMHHAYRNQGYQLFVSFFEIYGGKLFDLLNDRRKLCMREDGKQQVCIVGLQEFRVSEVETIRAFIEKGNATRSTGTTGANEESSRSHAILQLAIKRCIDGKESKPARLVGKLSFIDLAGSERGADTTDNDKQTRIEGAEINKSLLALKECIRALDNDQVHIPFRGSKLTEVLRDSFIGNSRTVMISCISPTSGSCEHTLNTLRYADRVKSLSKGNNPKKDAALPVNLRESTVLPLSSIAPTFCDSNMDIASESNRFAHSKPSESSPPFNIEPSFSVREDGRMVVDPRDHLSDHRFKVAGKGFDVYKPQEPGKLQRGNGKPEVYQPAAPSNRRFDAPMKRKDEPDPEFGGMQSDENLHALLKVEEDLVIAHRKEVEETIDIVREEMKLLVEVDQPGNQLDDYISKLNAILSQKAAGVVNLQMRLAKFQKLLNEHNVLVPTASS